MPRATRGDAPSSGSLRSPPSPRARGEGRLRTIDGIIAAAAAPRTPASHRGSGGTAACRPCRSPSAASPNSDGSSSVPTLRITAGSPGRCVRQMRAALGAELARHRVFEIAARELLRRAGRVAKALGRHQHEHVGRRRPLICWQARQWHCAFEHRLALGDIADLAAIASAFQFHRIPPEVPLARAAPIITKVFRRASEKNSPDG